MYENFIKEKYEIPSNHKLRPRDEHHKYIYDEISPDGKIIGSYEVDIKITPFDKERCIRKIDSKSS